MVSTNRSRSRSAGENLRYPDSVRAGLINWRSSRNLSFDGVRSGNSAVSRAKTCPMLNRFGPAAPLSWATARGTTCSPDGQVEARRVEREAELPDLHLGTIGQHGRLDADAVVVRSVQRAQVPDLEGRAVAEKLSVTTRDRHVVEKDV